MTDAVLTFAPFAKVEEQPDGSLHLEGVISAPVRDRQGEIITADAMRGALAGWPGNIREMHALWAAGKALAAAVGEDGATRIAAKIVDREAAEKIRQGVYTGFSVGGVATRRNATDPTVIEELTLSEVSLVDVPANPAATFSVWKASAASPVEPPPEAHVGDNPEPAEPVCKTCGVALACPKCNAEAEKAAKREAAGLLHKLAEAEQGMRKVEAERDAARAEIAKVTAQRDALAAERARWPKGSLHAVPGRVMVVEKRDDVGGLPEDEDEPLTGEAAVRAEIKKAWTRPVVVMRRGG